MNLRTTLTLLLLLAALGAAAFFLRPSGEVDPYGKPEENRTEARQPTLLETLGVDAHRITRIALLPAGRPGMTAVRAGDGWRLAEPVQLALRTAETEALLLLPLAETRLLGEAQAAPAGGASTGALEFATDDGKTVRLELGDDLGAGVGRLRQGDKTFRVSTHLHGLLADPPPLVALVEPKLALPPTARLLALAVDSGRSHVRVVRGKPGAADAFALDLPGAPRAAAAAVAAYGDALAKLRLAEIPREIPSDAAAGFDKSPLKVTLEEAGGAKTTLEVGGPTSPDLKRRFIRLVPPGGAPLVAVVETEQVKNLPQGEGFFRDWRVSGMKVEEVREMRVERNGKPGILLVHDAAGQPTFADPKPAFALDADLGQAAFAALAGLKPTGTGPALANGKAQTRITLTDAFGRTEGFVLAEQGETCAIQRAGDAGSFIVPKAQVEVLLGGEEGLRDRNIQWLPDAGEVTRIQLNQSCGLRHEFMLKDGKWTAAGNAPLEEAPVAELARAFGQLRVKHFGAPVNNVPWLDDARKTLRTEGKLSNGIFEDLLLDMSVIVHTRNGQILALCGNAQGGAALCTPAGELLRVDLTPDMTRLLASEFRPHQLLTLPPAQIASIEIRDGAKSLRVARNSDGSYEASGTALTQAACASLFDALGNLQAEKPAEAAAPAAPSIGVTIRDLAGGEHRLVICAPHASFSDATTSRAFAWDPASPQAKALQTALDAMTKAAK